ncbi:MAG: hypothetical protein HYX92_00600 [Chloroflexi bacterium]|nr:hypothetical protein [Chloroflexota bacterium]
MELEKRGVPVATIASEEFASLGRAQLKMLGRSTLPIIKVPHPIGGQPKATVEKFADNIVEEVVEVLTVRSAQKAEA